MIKDMCCDKMYMCIAVPVPLELFSRFLGLLRSDPCLCRSEACLASAEDSNDDLLFLKSFSFYNFVYFTTLCIL